jgi:hypothetical protein
MLDVTPLHIAVFVGVFLGIIFAAIDTPQTGAEEDDISEDEWWTR